MSSLQDQLLKAGLVNDKQVKSAKKQKRKEDKVQHKSKEKKVDESKLRARQAAQEKAERDRKLNAELNEQANQKAIAAQIKQLIEVNRIDRGDADVPFNFADGAKIKKIYVTNELSDQLTRGRLAIVKLGDGYELVPAGVADKIAQRDDSFVVVRNDVSAEQSDEDDPYAEFEIPDDLMW